MKATFFSGCKVNVFLRIGDKLPNGYHELETMFLPLKKPSDTMIIEQVLTRGISVSCANCEIGKENTLTKAHFIYTSLRPLDCGVSVILKKYIPLGAGLGGGSSNAAVLLQNLNTLPAHDAYNVAIPPLDAKTLLYVAKSVGADVPFFLYNTPQLATGVGEKLTPCENPFSEYYLLLVCPPESIATVWAFAELDKERQKTTKKSDTFLTKITHQAKSPSAYREYFQNDFEDIIFLKYPNIAKIKDSLLSEGAIFSLLSGTGSSVYGIFDTEQKAKNFMHNCKYPTYLQRI